MALIDLTELMIDPDFVDPIQILKRQASVNAYGENRVTETVVNTLGSVQPASGKTLMRLPEALRVQSVSQFWVKGLIISDGTGGGYPDVIVFKGLRYQVQSILDYFNWPSDHGWCEGVCIRERPALL
jgi:hypothetical protein